MQAVFAKAAELGSGIVKRRALQESGLLPPMDAAEINTVATKEKVYVRERLQALGPPLEDSNTSVKPE